MMAISSIISFGFGNGTFSPGVIKLPTLGYATSAAKGPFCIAAVTTYSGGATTIERYQGGAAKLERYQGGASDIGTYRGGSLETDTFKGGVILTDVEC